MLLVGKRSLASRIFISKVISFSSGYGLDSGQLAPILVPHSKSHIMTHMVFQNTFKCSEFRNTFKDSEGVCPRIEQIEKMAKETEDQEIK